jgi:hypothetical protein
MKVGFVDGRHRAICPWYHDFAVAQGWDLDVPADYNRAVRWCRCNPESEETPHAFDADECADCEACNIYHCTGHSPTHFDISPCPACAAVSK